MVDDRDAGLANTPVIVLAGVRPGGKSTIVCSLQRIVVFAWKIW